MNCWQWNNFIPPVLYKERKSYIVRHLVIMENNNFYCVASPRGASRKVEASITFPRPLDASYEIALVYCSFLPSSGSITEIWLRAKSIKRPSAKKGDKKSDEKSEEKGDEKGDEKSDEGSDEKSEEITWFINFDDVPAHIPLTFVVPAIAKKIVEEVGNNLSEGTPVKIYDAGKFMGWWLKVQKYTEIELSPSLAAILGQSTLITNDGSSTIQLPVNPHENAGSDIIENVYYLTCNQLQPNCITEFGGATRLLDVVPIDDQNRIVRYSPSERVYQSLTDDIHHPRVSVELINRDGLPVFVDSPQFYVLLHLRKIAQNAVG
jgi:hypothetical protein